MSESLSDLMISAGPFKPGDIPPARILRFTASDYNQLRDELIRQRAVADDIRRELVCCDIYDRSHREGRAGPASEGPHSICFWGEAAARIAEGVSRAQS